SFNHGRTEDFCRPESKPCRVRLLPAQLVPKVLGGCDRQGCPPNVTAKRAVPVRPSHSARFCGVGTRQLVDWGQGETPGMAVPQIMLCCRYNIIRRPQYGRLSNEFWCPFRTQFRSWRLSWDTASPLSQALGFLCASSAIFLCGLCAFAVRFPCSVSSMRRP